MSANVNPAEQLVLQLSQLEQLLVLLHAENQLLQQQKPDELTALSAEKNELLLAIQSLDQLIGQSTSFNQEKAAGIHDNVLDKITSCLNECKTQNQINGQVIQHSQLAVERMKTSLLESHNKSSMTYDSKGKKSGGLSSIGIKA